MISNPITQHTGYTFRNVTDPPAPLTVAGISLDGGQTFTSLTLQPGETRYVPGFDLRFVDLTTLTANNFWVLIGGLQLVTAPFTIKTAASMGPSPASPTTKVRISGLALSVGEAGALAAEIAAGAGPPIICQNAETPQYDGPVGAAVAVDMTPARDWVDIFADVNLPIPIDQRNGGIQVAIGYAQGQDPVTKIATRVTLRVLPARDPAVLYPNVAKANVGGPSGLPDTWQLIGDMTKPRHSGVQMVRSDGKILMSHGSEDPFCEPYASLQTSVFDPNTLALVDGPAASTAGFDRGFSEQTVICSDTKHRGHVAVGFPSNDEILNATVCVEAYTEEVSGFPLGQFDAQAWLHYQGAPAGGGIVISTLPVDAHGNFRMAFGPNRGPTAGLPSLSPATMITPPALFPGAFFPALILGGQFFWSTASKGHFPPAGFDFGQLFGDEVIQQASGYTGVAFPAPGPPTVALPANSFCVDAAGGNFYFSPDLGPAGASVMVVTPYLAKAGPSASRPAPAKRIRGLVAGFERLPNGKMMLVGGLGSPSHPGFIFATPAGVGTPEIIDPSTGLWTDAAAMPVPVTSEPHNCVVHPNGKLYCIGGATTSFLDPGGVLITNAVQIYDPAADAWALGTPFPNAGVYRSCRLIVLDDGDILLAGGAQGSAGPFAQPPPPASPQTWRYTPSTDSWRRVGDMMTAIAAGWMYKTSDGRGLMVGGSQHGSVQTDRQLTLDVQIFDPLADRWFCGVDVPPPVGSHWYRASLLPSGKFVYAGGITNTARNNLQGQPTTQVWQYSPPKR